MAFGKSSFDLNDFKIPFLGKNFEKLKKQSDLNEVIDSLNQNKKDFIETYCGCFLNCEAMGTLGDHSFYIGTFMLGGNDLGDSRAEVENYEELLKFFDDYKDICNIHTYAIKKKLMKELYYFGSNMKYISMEPSHFFQSFFESIEEIEDMLVFNKYKSKFQEFLISLEKKDATNNEKKEILEDLTIKLIKLIPEFEILNKDIRTEAEEIDLVVENRSKYPDLQDFLGFTFIIECRNISGKITSKQVKDFGLKIKSKSLKTGIFINANGITGKNQEQDGRRSVRDFAIQGIRILILDKQDLVDIGKGYSVLWILRRAYCRFFFKGFDFKSN